MHLNTGPDHPESHMQRIKKSIIWYFVKSSKNHDQQKNTEMDILVYFPKV